MAAASRGAVSYVAGAKTGYRRCKVTHICHEREADGIVREPTFRDIVVVHALAQVQMLAQRENHSVCARMLWLCVGPADAQRRYALAPKLLS